MLLGLLNLTVVRFLLSFQMNSMSFELGPWDVKHWGNGYCLIAKNPQLWAGFFGGLFSVFVWFGFFFSLPFSPLFLPPAKHIFYSLWKLLIMVRAFFSAQTQSCMAHRVSSLGLGVGNYTLSQVLLPKPKIEISFLVLTADAGVLVLLWFKLTNSVSFIYQLVLFSVLVSKTSSGQILPKKQGKDAVPLPVLSEN